MNLNYPVKRKKLRADLMLIGALVLSAAALLLWPTASRRSGGEAVVYVDGQRTAAYPLSRDATVRLVSPDGTSYNILTISDGTADVTDAGCPDRICVSQGWLSDQSVPIVCLPHRLIIKLRS